MCVPVLKSSFRMEGDILNKKCRKLLNYQLLLKKFAIKKPQNKNMEK
uniref:Uncharacterized protein n=1 Tax=Lepeophtheirus salmonis TaxID=72036 RepID=A0A0K2U173_LEPSM